MIQTPPLEIRTCQVWWARHNSKLAGYASLLSSSERETAAAYRQDADRRRFIAGCVISRLVLAGLLGLPAAQVPLDRRCQRCGAPHGRPRLHGEEIAFSVSHSGDRVAVAFVRHAQVGVDVEAIDRSAQSPEMLDAVLAPSERAELASFQGPDRPRAFLTYWTRKEAVVKATGDGLAAQLPGIVVSAPDELPQLISYGECATPRLTTMAELHPGRGYAAALAVIGERPTSITELDAEAILAQQLRPREMSPNGSPR
ncbi:4'-phosphopantetheinyl transferase family protein [Flindersiella endophytica]